jgi:RNA polymerase sigma-70 factor (ECF subfamily)
VTTSDAELVESSWADPEAFTTLFDRHFASVYSFCARRTGASVGEEMASEAFCRAFAGRHDYDLAQPNARPWLLGIALNVVRERLRTVGRADAAYGRAAAFASASAVDPATFVAAALDARQDLAMIAKALVGFPTEEVETLLLHIWDELSYIECADALGVPVGTVRSRLNRLRNRLRAVLDDRPAPKITPFPLRHGGTDERPI